MRDVFISHADEDALVALALARGLNAAGFSTWCYEDDSDPGPSYLSQIDEELEATQAVVLVISPSSLSSRQVTKEIVRAHEAGKPFIPLRRGVTHETVQHQREWRMALGASVSIAMPDDGNVTDLLPRVIRGLERTGVRPGGASNLGDAPTPRRAPAPLPPQVEAMGTRFLRAVDRVSDPTRLAITTVVGVLGVLGTWANIARAVNPTGEEAQLYRAVPTIGTANLWGNVAGLLLNLALLYSVWQLYSGRTGPIKARIRLVTAFMLMSIAVWLVVVVFAALFPPYGRLPGSGLLSVLGAVLMAALIAAVPAALVRTLFRR